jgi:fatty acid/phospholipid biosynthesis enzyme
VEGAVIKAHGASGATAIMNALRQAYTMLSGDVAGKIREGLSGLSRNDA